MPKEDLHVVPLNDQGRHRLDRKCRCRPRVDVIHGAYRDIVIHEASDGRGGYERRTGEGLPGKGWMITSADGR